jgi:hypothetical protein
MGLGDPDEPLYCRAQALRRANALVDRRTRIATMSPLPESTGCGKPAESLRVHTDAGGTPGL